MKLRDAVVVVRTPDGRIELNQSRGLAAGEGLVAGGAIGVIAGLLLGVPVAGALLGLAGGGGLGLPDTGIPDPRLRELGKRLEPGHALLCILVDDGSVPALRDGLSAYGDVVDTPLSVAAEP